MFTGLIETMGVVSEVKPTPAGFRLRLTTTMAPELAAGDSLAVNGVCLTVVSADAEGIHADISPETARVSALGALRRGALVNLERPLRADARLGGHFVQGHVDATATIEEIREDGDSVLAHDPFSAAARPLHRAEGIDRGERDQPDGRRRGRQAFRRAADSIHVGTHQPASRQAGGHGQHRVRHSREVRWYVSPSSRG